VRPEQALQALRLLEDQGYALRKPAEHLSEAQRKAMVQYAREAELLHGDRRVELHWRLIENPLLLKGIDASSPAETVALPGIGDLRALAKDDLFTYLCVHGACHRWSRLKWLADLHALIATDGDAEITRLHRYARDRGAGLCAEQALLLCQKLLGMRLPADLAGELNADRRLTRLVRVALDAMVGGDAATELGSGVIETARDVCGRFMLGEGRAFYAAECRQLLMGNADPIRFPLPAGWHFLYPVLRFPLWLWRRGSWAAGAIGASQTKAASSPRQR
jgi:hypothetical protein